jgi:3-oxoadipate enol-lactonase/4-carboxymuconolactone decarboxylase
MTVELAYEETGPADGRPVVLAGSLGSDRHMWDPQVEPLVAAGFRVIRYDHRGHGASPAPTGPYTVAELSADAIALLDRLRLRRVSWVGLSLGGMVGMWLAEHEPSRIDRMVLCCTSASLGPASMWQERAHVARTSGMATLAGPVVERWLTPGFREANPGTVTWLQDMVASHDPEGYASCCTAIETMSIVDDLATIPVPTLVIAGADDPATPPDHGRVIADAVPGARLVVVPDAAHLGNVEQPTLFTGLILEHLQPDRRTLGMSVRRSVLGDEHVIRAVAATTEFTKPFQDYITEGAWGTVWSRPELDRRTRSAITLAALTALRAHEELPMHVRAARGNGLSEAEIAEILLHTTVYAGAPAGNAAFAIAKRTLDEMGQANGS